jgi:signal transduction histidine kinase
LGITERVRELCGNIAIQSEPGKGTRLEVMLPRKTA